MVFESVPQPVVYVLDEDTRLASVAGDWERFAAANGALELLPPAPLGRRIDAFISDPTTIQIYDALYAKARRTGDPITFPIRCDGPDVVRDLSLTICARPGGFIVHSTVVATERREIVPFPVAPARGNAPFIRSCSWCKRIDVRGKWFEIEVAVLTLSLFRQPQLPDITHGICDDCERHMEAVLAE